MAEPTTRLTAVQGVNIPCAFFDEKPIFPVSSDELKELPAAFVAAQSAFERAKKDKDNPFFKSVYADLASVLDACTTALTKNGFAVIQPVVAVNGEAYLLTRLIHKSGEWLQSSVPLTTLDSIKNTASEAPAPSAGLGAGGDEGKKKKSPGVQALGSEITYMRRYCLSSLLGIAADDDDDGNAATAAQQQHQKSAPAKGIGGLGR